MVAFKFYYDVITRSRLQLINTLIGTFYSKLCAFLAEKKKQESQQWLKLSYVDGTVDKSLADQEISKYNVTLHYLGKI